MFSSWKAAVKLKKESLTSFNRLCSRPMCSINLPSEDYAPGTYKTGIVLLNMGGPETTAEVPDYLRQIMTDKDMIQLPFAQNLLGKWIARLRSRNVKEKYKQIGGGSPILSWTRRQGELLCKILDNKSPRSKPHNFYIAFRYVRPYINEALDQVQADGCTNVVLLSQYPQYSCSTSGSSFNQVRDYFKGRDLPEGWRLSVIDRWPAHPLLVSTFAENITNELEKFNEDVRRKVLILFSAHSLPLKVVLRGDSYPSEVGATAEAVMSRLEYRNPYSIVWQSRVGPVKWLGPFTDEAMKSYVLQGHKHFLLVPIAFVNEHIETLHEMDIEYCQELAERIGVKEIRRVSTPNDHPLFIQALADLVTERLKPGRPLVTPKFLKLCPHCNNRRCYETKEWFKKVCVSNE